MNHDDTSMLNFAEGNKPKLPSGLNVLTILTFIGCAFALIGSIWSFITAKSSYEKMIDAQDKMENAPAWAKSLMSPEMIEMSRKSLENRVPILILGIVGVALCFYGALQMRQLKKQGYIMWLLGEILPLVAAVFFVGFGIFSGFYLLILLFPVAFIILYTTQRKHLVY